MRGNLVPSFALAALAGLSAVAAERVDFAWRSPQLESSAAWDRDGMLWTSPWGEKVKFFPKSEKTPSFLNM